MGRPPDPGDGGSDGGGDKTEASVAYYVTVSSTNESAMDSDVSVGPMTNNRSTLKRSRQHKKNCKTCNKRKKKYCRDTKDEQFCCNCSDSDTIPEKMQYEKSSTTSNITLTAPSLESTLLQANAPSVDVPNLPSNKVDGGRPTPIGRTFYESTDSMPYTIHVQKETVELNDNHILHPITFGKFLKLNKFNNIINGSVKRIGRNRMALSFSNYIDANNFLKHPTLSMNKFKAFIPTFNVTRLGIVKGIPADWSVEEIMENVNLPIGCGKILKVRRLNYKVITDGNASWKPSQTVVITFDGQVLPKRIFICYNALPVELYTYPTIQCFKCCRYGHTKLQCRSVPRCFKCGKEHDGSNCNIEEDMASCCLCSGLHFATNRGCPEHSRQRAIKQSMADSCISYFEACKLHPPVKKSFADVVNTKNVHKNPQISNNNNKHSSLSQSPIKSYKKTVVSKPRIHNNVQNHHYDYNAHRQLTKDYDMSSPSNGCALKSSNENNTCNIYNIITNLINSLSQSNIINPDHAAIIIDALNKSSTINGPHIPQYNSVELSKCAQ